MHRYTHRPRFLRLLFPTVQGTSRSVEVGFERRLALWADGAWFDGSSVPALENVHASDLRLRPIFEAPLVQPWDPRVAFTLCDILLPDGRPHPRDVRQVLSRVIESASALGMKLQVGSELEFYLVRKEADRISPLDTGGYFSTPPQDQGVNFRREVVEALDLLGVHTVSHHHEVGQGQQELGIGHTDALREADWITISRLAISETAMNQGIVATFMPKPFSRLPGNGMHLHQSLWDKTTGRNLFASDSQGQLSELAQGYVAGILEHAPALTAILASTVNSFRRLRPGFEAPTLIAWGPRNRTAMIRVPHFTGHSTARIEIRCADPLASPYLAIASTLAAGLDGINRELEPPTPAIEDVFEHDDQYAALPTTLAEAMSALKNDTVICDALGRTLVDQIVSLGKKAWREFTQVVGTESSSTSTWEIENYLLAI